MERQELQFGAYEFKAPSTYSSRKAIDPTYVFVIDVSQFSHPLGLFQQVIQSVKMCLDYIPNAEHASICFVTFDVCIHFYQLSSHVGGDPTVLWVSDQQDPFVPLPKNKLLLKVVEDREKIDAFLDKILTMHTFENKKQQSPYLCTGAAIIAAKHLIEDEGKHLQ